MTKFTLCHVLTQFYQTQFTLIHWSHIPCSYAISSLQHQNLLSLPETYTLGILSALAQLLHSLWSYLLLPSIYSFIITYWAPSYLWGSSSNIISFCLFILFTEFSCKNTGVGCHFLPQWTMFCHNSPLWPICLGLPCVVCLTASLSYTNLFSRTRL